MASNITFKPEGKAGELWRMYAPIAKSFGVSQIKLMECLVERYIEPLVHDLSKENPEQSQRMRKVLGDVQAQ